MVYVSTQRSKVKSQDQACSIEKQFSHVKHIPKESLRCTLEIRLLHRNQIISLDVFIVFLCLAVCSVWIVLCRVLDSLDILSELFDQLDVHISFQEGGTHLLQHGI